MSLLGEKIKEVRKAKGLTQEELSELSKVNLRTIQRIENDENSPRGATLNLISDALKIDISKFQNVKNTKHNSKILKVVIEGFFLIILNLALMGVFGFLMLDSNANINSRFGAYLISFLIPYFIVTNTKRMSSLERLLKFGSGFILYFFLVFFIHSFHTGFMTGLYPCFAIALGTLYYGSTLVKV